MRRENRLPHPRMVETSIRRSISVRERCGQGRIHFPAIRSLKEIFSSIRKIDDIRAQPRTLHTWPNEHGDGTPAKLSSFVSIHSSRRSYFPFDVEVRPEIIQWIPQHMLLSDYTLGFKLTERCDGTVLVSLEYDRIIGSRWIAIVPATELDGRKYRSAPVQKKAS